LEKTSLNVKFFDWDYLHLTALMKETYFSRQIKKVKRKYLEIKVYVTSERKVHLAIKNKSPKKEWKCADV
jgi:hypothetical protein